MTLHVWEEKGCEVTCFYTATLKICKLCSANVSQTKSTKSKYLIIRGGYENRYTTLCPETCEETLALLIHFT